MVKKTTASYCKDILKMALQTRGSASIDKAQRRLANLKSIDENLDLGYGLTIENYTDTIESIRTALDKHNTLISNLDASRKTVTELEKALSNLSERMLSGVATKYGKDSIQYSKAGGSNRRRGSNNAIAPSPNASTNPIVTTNLNSNTLSNARNTEFSMN
jgi:hypothetical protein